MYLSETQDYVMKLYQIFHGYCRDTHRKGILYNVITRKDTLILKNCLGHFCIEHQIRYNVIQIRGVGSGAQNLPKDFCSVLKVEELSIWFSIFIFWKNLRIIGLKTTIKLSHEFHTPMKKSKQQQMTGPTRCFCWMYDSRLVG